MHKYRATKDGVLEPYRYIRKGQVIHSTKAIKKSWLEDESEYQRKRKEAAEKSGVIVVDDAPAAHAELTVSDEGETAKKGASGKKGSGNKEVI